MTSTVVVPWSPPADAPRDRTATGSTVNRSAVRCGAGVPSWRAASASASSRRKESATASARALAGSRPTMRVPRRPLTVTSGSGSPLTAFHSPVLATTLARCRRALREPSGVCWTPLAKVTETGSACCPRSTTAVSGLASAEGPAVSSSALVSWADSPGRCVYIRRYHWCLPGMTGSRFPMRCAAARTAASSFRSASARSGEPTGAVCASVRLCLARIRAKVRSK